MNYILYILLKKFKVYYTSIRSARYVFVFLQSKFLKEKRSGMSRGFLGGFNPNSGIPIRGFNPVTGNEMKSKTTGKLNSVEIGEIYAF